MRNYLVVEGRTTRKEYWLFFAVLFLMLLVATAVDAVAFGRPSLLFAVAALAHLVPFITASVRRLHDADLSGWLYLLNALPFGQVIFIILTCLPPTLGPNKYGDAPENQPSPTLATNRFSPVVREPAFGVAAPAAPQAPVAPIAASAPVTRQAAILDPSALDQLERLSSLRASGVLTDTEFASLKAKLLPST